MNHTVHDSTTILETISIFYGCVYIIDSILGSIRVVRA